MNKWTASTMPSSIGMKRDLMDLKQFNVHAKKPAPKAVTKRLAGKLSWLWDMVLIKMGNIITFPGIKMFQFVLAFYMYYKIYSFKTKARCSWQIYNKTTDILSAFPHQLPSDLWSWVTLNGGSHQEWQFSQYIKGLSAKAKRFLHWTNWRIAT